MIYLNIIGGLCIALGIVGIVSEIFPNKEKPEDIFAVSWK